MRWGQGKEVLAGSGRHVLYIDVGITGDVQQDHIWVRLGQNFGRMQAFEVLRNFRLKGVKIHLMVLMHVSTEYQHALARRKVPLNLLLPQFPLGLVLRRLVIGLCEHGL